jgi:phosphoglycolate phosphatase
MPHPAEFPAPEFVDPNYPRGPFRCVVFDFDGTLSLIRGNWQGLMIPRMVEVLLATGTQEPRDVLVEIVSDFVTRLTGRPTMLQMEALADEVASRGQPRPDPQIHLDEYLERLIAQSHERIRAVQTAQTPADDLLVPGSRPLVERLAERDFLLVISSGTELDHVRHEAGILGLAPHFSSRIYGPVNNDPSFSKQQVLEMLIAEHGLAGDEIVCIGDGPAEILAGRAVGALTIGVASDEVDRSGQIHPLKREHLVRSGVHAVIPDYRRLGDVLALMGVD